MRYDQFVGQVQHRARLGSLGDAVAAIRATLETLGERLAGGEAKDLASQLPREIGYYLYRGNIAGWGERFAYREFIARVAIRESVQLPLAAYHARVVMEIVSEAVSLGEMEDIVQQLPPDYAPLFAGSTGNVRRRRRGGRDTWEFEGQLQDQEFERRRGQIRSDEGAEPYRAREEDFAGAGEGQPQRRRGDR